jgi:hypothetical protein
LQLLFKVFLVFELISDKSKNPTRQAALNDVVDASVPLRRATSLNMAGPHGQRIGRRQSLICRKR